MFRALVRYAPTHPALDRATMNSVGALLLSHREDIHHPNREVAIEFGLLAVASVLPLFFRYLGIKEKSS